ncbi:proteasome subunit alpha type-2-like [Scaptodrosophila lebanonensis]|uniref:Proteasome subunit alpha type-2-like n=1 Tax=Drosophila lebanonensis TaxID=7225 RepID=A0A6J2U8D9_DROLE|nr:proteasome subunit alpha type-2-like [Scaptodrosophila lebanonensis]
MSRERYSFSLTTFSPAGNLAQMEYAMAAVADGATSVGIVASNGVVIATEHKFNSPLVEVHSIHRVEKISNNIGSVYSGMGPDYRMLVKHARKMATKYYLTYKEAISTEQLVQRMVDLMQEYTQSGGVRPFGASMLICGWDFDRPHLYQVDPTSASFAWQASALGKNAERGKIFLEKRFSPEMELPDAVHTAILALKEGFQGKIDCDNIEVGVCDERGFRRLEPTEIDDYLSNIM